MLLVSPGDIHLAGREGIMFSFCNDDCSVLQYAHLPFLSYSYKQYRTYRKDYVLDERRLNAGRGMRFFCSPNAQNCYGVHRVC